MGGGWATRGIWTTNEATAISTSDTVAAPTHCLWTAGSPCWHGAAPRLPAPPSPTRIFPPASLRPGPGVFVQLHDEGHGLFSQVTHVTKADVACPCVFPFLLPASICLVGSALSLLSLISRAALSHSLLSKETNLRHLSLQMLLLWHL